MDYRDKVRNRKTTFVVVVDGTISLEVVGKGMSPTRSLRKAIDRKVEVWYEATYTATLESGRVVDGTLYNYPE